ncbi:hypothetical protein GBF38_000380 [Nibea albiflora]|nr:hypothetical protein GBF38_000380 [Nibea albiflora]
MPCLPRRGGEEWRGFLTLLKPSEKTRRSSYYGGNTMMLGHNVSQQNSRLKKEIHRLESELRKRDQLIEGFVSVAGLQSSTFTAQHASPPSPMSPVVSDSAARQRCTPALHLYLPARRAVYAKGAASPRTGRPQPGSRLVRIHNLRWPSPTASPFCRRMHPSILTLRLQLPPHLAPKSPQRRPQRAMVGVRRSGGLPGASLKQSLSTCSDAPLRAVNL